MSTTSSPSPATIPFPLGSFIVPPPRSLIVPPPNSLNIPPPNVMDCPPPSNFSLTTSSFASATPLVSCTFSSPSPSSSNSTTVASATGLVSRKPLTNGGNSNSIVDPAKVNGDLRHEPRKQFENYGDTLDSRGDRRSFGGFCGSVSRALALIVDVCGIHVDVIEIVNAMVIEDYNNNSFIIMVVGVIVAIIVIGDKRVLFSFIF
ncbi:hypothetical protein QQG55_22725 [Brugia pahangi]|uniref:Transmembrane protein n=1 Tax=Brugia pahangi TaxID=6280 RepID=A0A0N4T0T4_BRUPA|nr:unnamed protein product [Brugia pahangi]